MNEVGRMQMKDVLQYDRVHKRASEGGCRMSKRKVAMQKGGLKRFDLSKTRASAVAPPFSIFAILSVCIDPRF
jgi:hypothetical protein